MDSYVGEPVAVIDTETTSVRPDEARIVQVSVVLLDAALAVERVWSSYCDPQLRWIGGVRAHQLMPADVAGAPSWRQLQPTVVDMLAGRVVAAHNAPYDLAVLAAESRRSQLDWQPPTKVIDTLTEARRLMPGLPNKRLHTVAMNLGVDLNNAHDAEADAVACADVLRALRALNATGHGQVEA